MKYLLTLFFCAFFSIAGRTQKHFTIVYETKARVPDSIRNVIKYFNLTLVIRDSLSYSYYPDIPIKRGLKNSLPLGSKYWPKSSFSNANSCSYLLQYGFFDKPKKQWLVIDSCWKVTWQIQDETKVIAGYTCKKATGFIHGLNYIVWYAPDLPASFGPSFSHNLPGTILEYWHDMGHAITTAVDIKKEAVEIVEPNFCKRISQEEYNRMSKR